MMFWAYLANVQIICVANFFAFSTNLDESTWLFSQDGVPK